MALDPDRLTAELVGPGRRWRCVEVVASTDSTNADLAAAARAGVETDRVLLTEDQTAGRGRLDRQWVMPAGTGLACSVLVAPTVDPVRWTWLPLLGGLAVTEALRRACGVAAALKWPNDVLVAERKVCGVLAERVQTPSGTAGVLGMGINVDLTPDQLPVPAATSLALVGATTLDRTVIAVTVLRALDLLLAGWEQADDDAAFAQAYAARCTTIGRQVRVELPDGLVTGTAEGVDAAGRLVVLTPTGARTLGAGDVVHLR